MVRVGVDAAAGADADDALVLLCTPPEEEVVVEEEEEEEDAGADLADGVRAPCRGCCWALDPLPLLPPLLNAKHPIRRRGRRPGGACTAARAEEPAGELCGGGGRHADGRICWNGRKIGRRVAVVYPVGVGIGWGIDEPPRERNLQRTDRPDRDEEER